MFVSNSENRAGGLIMMSRQLYAEMDLIFDDRKKNKIAPNTLFSPTPNDRRDDFRKHPQITKTSMNAPHWTFHCYSDGFPGFPVSQKTRGRKKSGTRIILFRTRHGIHRSPLRAPCRHCSCRTRRTGLRGRGLLMMRGIDPDESTICIL